MNHENAAIPDARLSTARPRKRPRGLSVRVLMLLVLVVGVALGWLGYRVRLQRDAVAAIARAGGTVNYEWELSAEGQMDPMGRPKAPKWLVDLAGPDYFGHVTSVYLGPETTDEVMTFVGRLARLQYLDARNVTQLSDSGLVHVRRLPQLTIFRIHQCPGVTGACLVNFSGLNRLVVLELGLTPIADADLVQVKGLTELKWLELTSGGAGISDAGMSHLKRMINLRGLSIDGSRVTSAGLANLRDMGALNALSLTLKSDIRDLAPIRNLTSLAELSLARAPIDDAGLAPVAELRALITLDLRGTNVADAGLKYLEPLTSLQSLDLRGTRVTGAGLKNLTPLKGLQVLALEFTKITDDSLAALSGCSLLQHLNLQGTSITDAGLAHLAGLTSLRSLNLSNTKVTDGGLEHLVGLRRCDVLWVEGTKVTAAGIAVLKAKCPWMHLAEAWEPHG